MEEKDFKSDLNYLDKSIEELENNYWEEPEFKSGLTMMCYRARKKKISELTEDEIITLIGQKIGLKYLLPVAAKKVEKYLEVLDEFYSSNLLDSIYNLEKLDWNGNEKIKEKLLMLLYDCSNDLNDEYKNKTEKYLKENNYNF